MLGVSRNVSQDLQKGHLLRLHLLHLRLYLLLLPMLKQYLPLQSHHEWFQFHFCEKSCYTFSKSGEFFAKVPSSCCIATSHCVLSDLSFLFGGEVCVLTAALALALLKILQKDGPSYDWSCSHKARYSLHCTGTKSFNTWRTLEISCCN